MYISGICNAMYNSNEEGGGSHLRKIPKARTTYKPSKKENSKSKWNHLREAIPLTFILTKFMFGLHKT